MKNTILTTIYNEFEHWSSSHVVCCHKGCATCCTQDVAITALEGERILAFCLKNQDGKWIAQKLENFKNEHPAQQTTNEYIQACLDGEVAAQDDAKNTNTCPFLEHNACSIYPVRPFSCRCFVSEETCSASGSAVISDNYLMASMTMMQIIEHLGQFEYWGNMADVLLSLTDCSENREIETALQDRSLAIQARLRVLQAKPLPGFVLSEHEMEALSPLISTIFQTRVGGKTIEQILNGR